MSNTEYDEEIHIAEVMRSIESVTDAWENSTSLSADEMCEHLDHITAVIDGDISFREFIEITRFNVKNNS